MVEANNIIEEVYLSIYCLLILLLSVTCLCITDVFSPIASTTAPPIVSTITEGQTNFTVTPTQGPFCDEFSLRLQNRVTSATVSPLPFVGNVFFTEGNIEVCISGTYFSVCDVGWDDVDADFACRLLDFDPRIYRKL